MEMVRDVLDNQIHDKQNCKVGKVDGIVIVLRKGRPPRVIALELGVVTVAHRIHRGAERTHRIATARRRDRAHLGHDSLFRAGEEWRHCLHHDHLGSVVENSWSRG